jgi:Ca2+-binding EF-hand superfamily protein
VANDGRLTKIYLEELLGDHIPDSKWKHLKYLINCIFTAIDTNNDGYIDFLEYLMSRKFFQTDLPQEKAEFIFRIIDRNGDHQVTQKEIERILDCLKDYHHQSSNENVLKWIENGSKPAAHHLLNQLDEDKSGLIDRSEFLDGWLKDETVRALFTF